MFVLLIYIKRNIMKYSRTIFLSTITMILFSLVSCINCVEPQGEVTTENIILENFTKIEVAIPANVKIITGDSAKISISSYESYLSAIKTTVRRGTLKLEGDICNADNDEVNIVITLPELEGVSISGSANVFSEMPVRTDELELEISGSGQISLNVFANSIVSEISGSGEININGTCQKLKVEIAGSGEFKGLGLNSYKASIEIAGSGRASVFALNELDAEVAGSGVINYSGEPELSVDIAGSGSVNKIN